MPKLLFLLPLLGSRNFPRGSSSFLRITQKESHILLSPLPILLSLLCFSSICRRGKYWWFFHLQEYSTAGAKRKEEKKVNTENPTKKLRRKKLKDRDFPTQSLTNVTREEVAEVIIKELCLVSLSLLQLLHFCFLLSRFFLINSPRMILWSPLPVKITIFRKNITIGITCICEPVTQLTTEIVLDGKKLAKNKELRLIWKKSRELQATIIRQCLDHRGFNFPPAFIVLALQYLPCGRYSHR